jgi:hypothetical protein
VRLNELNLVEGDVVDLEALKAAGVLNRAVKSAKIIASGEVTPRPDHPWSGRDQGRARRDRGRRRHDRRLTQGFETDG